MSASKILRGLTNKVLYQTMSTRSSVQAAGCWASKDDEARTAQQWAAEDYRFTRSTKNSANDFAKVAPRLCKERVVCCDGGGGPTGHPKVYIDLDKPGNHACAYCGLRFVHCH